MKSKTQIFINLLASGVLIICISCKNFNENFNLEKAEAVKSIDNSSNKLANADSLSAIFDENGTIIAYENDCTIVSDINDTNKGIKKFKEISTDKNTADDKSKVFINKPKQNSTPPQTKTIQKNTKIIIPAKIISKESERIKNIGIETNTERDHTLQKSNHSVPDL